MLHMVFGEMVPKNLALIGPERTLLALARPMAAYLFVARPVARSLQGLSNGLTRLLRVEPHQRARRGGDAGRAGPDGTGLLG